MALDTADLWALQICVVGRLALRKPFQLPVLAYIFACDRLDVHAAIARCMASCHIGKIEDHFPATDIRRLLLDRPDAIGLAVSDMLCGLSGMGDEASREA